MAAVWVRARAECDGGGGDVFLSDERLCQHGVIAIDRRGLCLGRDETTLSPVCLCAASGGWPDGRQPRRPYRSASTCLSRGELLAASQSDDKHAAVFDRRARARPSNRAGRPLSPPKQQRAHVFITRTHMNCWILDSRTEGQGARRRKTTPSGPTASDAKTLGAADRSRCAGAATQALQQRVLCQYDLSGRRRGERYVPATAVTHPLAMQQVSPFISSFFYLP